MSRKSSEEKILKETPEYVECQGWFGKELLQCRAYKKERKIEFRFTDAFARSCGAKDLDDLIRTHNLQHEIAIAGLPEWVELTKNGFRWEKKAILN